MFEKSIALINKARRLLATGVLPFTCIFCHNFADREQDLCQACLNDLPIVAQKCPRCAQKVAVSAKDRLCGACLKNPPPFSAAYSLFAYEPPIIGLILGLKFHHQLAYARILGELMAEAVRFHWYRDQTLPELLLPMPLHPERLKERGFNQALELARPLAKKLHLPLDLHSAQRLRHTAAQMTLDAEKRAANVKNAFSVQARVAGKSIALLDDVVTTGATSAELSRELLEQGATRVDLWCCARA